MNRQQMLDFLAQAGVDVSKVTDAIPDDFLMMVVQAMQAKAAPDAAAGTTAAQGDNGTGTTIDTMASQGTGTGAGAVPKTVTMKFSELDATLKSIQGRAEATDKLVAKNEQAAKLIRARTVCEQAVKDGRLSPAQVEIDRKTGEPRLGTVLGRLLRANHVPAYAFSEGGSVVLKSEFDLQIEEIQALPTRTFAERLPAGGSSGASPEVEEARKRAEAYANERNKELAAK